MKRTHITWSMVNHCVCVGGGEVYLLYIYIYIPVYTLYTVLYYPYVRIVLKRKSDLAGTRCVLFLCAATSRRNAADVRTFCYPEICVRFKGIMFILPARTRTGSLFKTIRKYDPGVRVLVPLCDDDDGSLNFQDFEGGHTHTHR